MSPARPLETILSLSGVPLDGGNLVRMVYLDEAGISNPEHEPFIVVAGVIIHADCQWKAIEAHIRSLVADFIPQSDQDGFVFHATELFSGGKYFDRDVWPRCIRWQILDELVAIPRKFDLPISCGVQNRSVLAAQLTELSLAHQTALGHLVAFSHFVVWVERWMKAKSPAEVALLIAEDHPEVRQLIKDAQEVAKDPKKVAVYGLRNDFEDLPLTKIVDTVHFASKAHSIMLQLADACAFAIKRKAMKKSDSKRFFEPLASQIIWRTNEISQGNFLRPLGPVMPTKITMLLGSLDHTPSEQLSDDLSQWHTTALVMSEGGEHWQQCLKPFSRRECAGVHNQRYLADNT